MPRLTSCYQKKVSRQKDLYIQDLELLKDTAEDIITELNRFKQVDEDDKDQVEETVINTDLRIPDAIIQLGARQKISSSIKFAACTQIDSNGRASAPAGRILLTPTSCTTSMSVTTASIHQSVTLIILIVFGGGSPITTVTTIDPPGRCWASFPWSWSTCYAGKQYQKKHSAQERLTEHQTAQLPPLPLHRHLGQSSQFSIDGVSPRNQGCRAANFWTQLYSSPSIFPKSGSTPALARQPWKFLAFYPEFSHIFVDLLL